jgi:hypothetical protein
LQNFSGSGGSSSFFSDRLRLPPIVGGSLWRAREKVEARFMPLVALSIKRCCLHR